jgi:arylsulfatase A-like enzyme
MTGRYHYRTGITDTWEGRSMMHGDEVTLAERLGAAGYDTGLFGKWHLGDNAPMRPEDQGFDEALYHRGGGLCQPGNIPGNGYFDPTLTHNGEREAHEGYCTDIFGEATAEFVAAHADSDDPFFAYLATNAPHVPLQVPDDAAAPYRERGCNDRRARIYGMISNIDANVGRVLDTLEETGQAENTIVVFTSDHGPQPVCPGRFGDDAILRFNGGRRGEKNTVYEGGINVPCFVRWPDRIPAGRDLDDVTHFIDLFPTLLAAGDGTVPADRPIDGENILGRLRGAGSADADRRIVCQWHRGDTPELHRNVAVVGERYKLVDGVELYDLQEDPGEQRDLAAERPELVRELRAVYEAWFADVTGERDERPRIDVGSRAENPTLLTRQDWRDAQRGWEDPTAMGHWDVTLDEAAVFDVEVRFQPLDIEGTAHLQFGDRHERRSVGGSEGSATFETVQLGPGDGELRAWASDGSDRYGATYVDLQRLD